MRFGNRPIVSVVALKFSFLVCFIILIAMVVMAGLVLKNARESLVEKIKFDTVNYARECKEAFFPETNKFLLHFNTLKTSKLDGIDYAMVMDSTGKILSHSLPDFIGNKEDIREVMKSGGPLKALSRSVFRAGEKFYELSASIKVKEMPVGAVKVGISDKSISGALRETYKKIILITLAVLAGAFILTVIVVSIMVQPVNELARAAYHVGQGNLNYKLNIRQNDEFGFLAKKFNDMVSGLRDRDFIRDTFGKYVTKEVARAVLNGGLKLGGERRNVSILVTDLRNFTKLVEKFSPEEVVDIINRYFKEMVDIITIYEGTLDKYIGDSILAIFGAPLKIEDHSKKAVLTGLAMIDVMKGFNSKLVSEGKEPMSMGIAVNSGEVLVGNIGSEKRMEYTAIGDAVNSAVRMEGLNKEWNTRFLISHSVYESVKDLVEVEDRQLIKLKGKEEGIRIYNVLGRKKEPVPTF